ncbi:MAG TPA: RNA-binding protein [Thermoanaerobaculia bacterium]|nr:RNA-binding protein [Thermoanaerobaculia bacterium]
MKLYVGNLSRDISDAQLADLVAPYGKPQSSEVVRDRITGESKGFAFVEMASDDEARATITALDGKEINGRTLKVNEARPRNDAGRRPGAQ